MPRVRDMEVSDPCKVPANRKNPGVDVLRQSRDRQGAVERVACYRSLTVAALIGASHSHTSEELIWKLLDMLD